MLNDGSYLSTIRPGGVPVEEAHTRAITVRVIDYVLPKMPDAQSHYRLITALLDPKAAPAMELAKLYHRGWELESIFDELKTHLLQTGACFAAGRRSSCARSSTAGC